MQDEMSYLEAGPSSKSEPTNDSAADADRQGDASAVQADVVAPQAAQQAAAPPVSTTGPKQDNGAQKSRPRAKPRPQAAKQKAASGQDGLSQCQEPAPDDGKSRFTQMLQESGVSVADWQEEGVY